MLFFNLEKMLEFANLSFDFVNNSNPVFTNKNNVSVRFIYSFVNKENDIYFIKKLGTFKEVDTAKSFLKTAFDSFEINFFKAFILDKDLSFDNFLNGVLRFYFDIIVDDKKHHSNVFCFDDFEITKSEIMFMKKIKDKFYSNFNEPFNDKHINGLIKYYIVNKPFIDKYLNGLDLPSFNF